MKVFKRAWIGIAPMAVVGALAAMPSPAAAQVDLYPVCQLFVPIGGPTMPPLQLLVDEAVSGPCYTLANGLYSLTAGL